MNRSLDWAIILSLLFFSCTDAPPALQFEAEFILSNVSPVGIASQKEGLLLSDPAHNRLLRVNWTGQPFDTLTGIRRPMHLSSRGDSVLIAEYLSDRILLLNGDSLFPLSVDTTLNAPASAIIAREWVAVADFYNHRISLSQGSSVRYIGREGHGPGQLYYPTDLGFHKGKLYVADAYNHRVQVFDLEGNPIQLIGTEDSIRVAAGLDLSGELLAVTDFEGNRVLVYNLDGELLQVLSNHLDHPTDVLFNRGRLFVTNYGSGTIAMYR